MTDAPDTPEDATPAPPRKSHGRLTISASLQPRDLMAPQRVKGAWCARIITLFPEAFPGVLGLSLTGKALAMGLWSLDTIDLSTQEGASAALTAIDNALSTVDSARADQGAVQNRFDSVLSSLASSSSNLTDARSRIQDADFAAETANLSKAQVLQQAGVAMLAQANQLPQNILSLLR